MSEQHIQTYHLTKEGLTRVLGSLEAEIMEIIWQHSSPVTIRDVWEEILPHRDISFNTVMTVMNRLVKKELLNRERGENSYLFRPVKMRKDFLEEISHEVARGLVKDFGESAIAQFVEAVEDVDPNYLQQLEDFIRRKKNKHE